MASPQPAPAHPDPQHSDLLDLPGPAPREAMPEPLSGVPEPAEIELAAGRPWLSRNETNRLIRRHGLAPTLVQAWVLDELERAIPLPAAEEKALIRAFLERRGVRDDAAVAAWLEQRQLSFDDLRILATRARRLEVFRLHRWQEEVEVYFLKRKPELDQVVYSLLRLPDEDQATELHQRLLEGEAEFSDLAPHYSSGQECQTRGQIGPVPLAAAHPTLLERLRVSQPGQLWPPFAIGDTWLVLRCEQHLPARLNEPMRSRMMDELFQSWLRERVALLMQGEALPPLPPLPPPA